MSEATKRTPSDERLIASLLKALEESQSVLADLTGPANRLSIATIYHRVVVAESKAHAAIAKAKGGA